MQYGAKPIIVNQIIGDCEEMMFYQDLLIKDAGSAAMVVEKRLKVFDKIIGCAACHFVGTYGLNKFIDWHVYISAKHLFQTKGKSYNRPGWHSDGFMTDDINYIWSSDGSTVFNSSDFNLTQDDAISIKEMEQQANPENDFTLPANTLVHLNQFNIHRVGEVEKDGLRTFVKVSFSKDKYDLIGNAHNYELNYNWEMKPRGLKRNIPQSILSV